MLELKKWVCNYNYTNNYFLIYFCSYGTYIYKIAPGPGVPFPSPYEIKNTYLEMEYKEIKEYVDIQREKWKTYGCTIMCDGWTGPTKLSIINFMVYSKGSTVFLKSVDASHHIKDHTYIYNLLKDVVKEVGKDNVVQVVSDNASAYKKAGKKLMERYNLYWTPCAAHCLDLMFEDIGKKESVSQVIEQARAVTNFLYNHGQLLSQMREFCKGDLVRPGPTRFATNYIAMSSMVKKKSNLKQLFTSDWWSNDRLSRSRLGKVIEKRVLDHHFWDQLANVVSIYEPMYTVLRLVDTEVVPTMPLLYEVFQYMKEAIMHQRGLKWVLDIINNRWDKQLSHPLHAAGINRITYPTL